LGSFEIFAKYESHPEGVLLATWRHGLPLVMQKDIVIFQNFMVGQMGEERRQLFGKCHLEDLLQRHWDLRNFENNSYEDPTAARADWCSIDNVPITLSEIKGIKDIP